MSGRWPVVVPLCGLTPESDPRARLTGQRHGHPLIPTTTFVLTEPIQLGDDAADGNPISATATGELTIHGVTRTALIELDAQLIGDTGVLVGSTDIVFADYDVAVPSSQIIVSVADHGILELQLLLTQR